MCSNHPKFDEDLLPAYLGVQFLHYNGGGARQIVIAEVVDIGMPRTDPPFNVLATGHAICSPLDKFDYERGKTIATGRAVKQWWTDDRRKDALLNIRRELPAFASPRV